MTGFLAVAQHMRSEVRAVCFLGDAVEGATISRHDPLGHESKPNVETELEAVQHDLGRIADTLPDAARLWVVGNHDERHDRQLAMRIAEWGSLAPGLADYFPTWRLA